MMEYDLLILLPRKFKLTGKPSFNEVDTDKTIKQSIDNDEPIDRCEFYFPHSQCR